MEAELASLSLLPYYSTAAQVHRPGPAQPSVPGGDRPRLVWEGELLSLGSVGAEAGSMVPFAWQVEQAGCLPSPGVSLKVHPLSPPGGLRVWHPFSANPGITLGGTCDWAGTGSSVWVLASP